MQSADGIDVPALISGYERGLISLKEAEPYGKSPRDPELEGALTSRVRDALALLATKVAPTMPIEQVDAWINVTSTALSNLPGRVAHEAAEAALFRPMTFVNQIETVVREEAEEIQARHRLALRRLRQLQAEIERAANPQPALPANDPAVPEWSPDRIRRMSRSAFWPELKRNGIESGSFTQAEIDAALGAEQAAA